MLQKLRNAPLLVLKPNNAKHTATRRTCCVLFGPQNADSTIKLEVSPYRRLAWEQDPDRFFIWSAGIRKSNLGPKHGSMYRATFDSRILTRKGEPRVRQPKREPRTGSPSDFSIPTKKSPASYKQRCAELEAEIREYERLLVKSTKETARLAQEDKGQGKQIEILAQKLHKSEDEAQLIVPNLVFPPGVDLCPLHQVDSCYFFLCEGYLCLVFYRFRGNISPSNALPCLYYFGNLWCHDPEILQHQIR